jgi:methyl coenzyme M reductase subunit C
MIWMVAGATCRGGSLRVRGTTDTSGQTMPYSVLQTPGRSYIVRVVSERRYHSLNGDA